MNLKEIKELLNKYDANALKKYGQNFLIDENILNTIANSLDNEKGCVIEIGPGLGSLTRKLVIRFNKVLAYEIDPKMIEVLNDTILESNFKIIAGDFLKTNIEKDIQEYFNQDNIYVIANLPYYITTPILLKILEEAPTIKKMTIMIQREVASRFLGKPNTKDYNSLSVLIQTYMNVSKVCDVSSNCFYPAPLVDSTVIKLERKEKPDYEIKNEQQFQKINRMLFRQRRKTIVNNLKEGYSKEEILNVLNKLNIKETERSESLTCQQIIELANLLTK